MKKATKRLLAFTLCCVLCGLFCLFSSAKSTNEYGLGLTADSVVNGNSATVALSLENSNSFDVNDIEIVYTVPEGLELKSEVENKNGEGCVLPVGSLSANGTYKAEIIFDVISSSVLTYGEEKVEAVAVKKTNEKAVIAAVIAAAVIVTLIIVLVRKHKKAAAMMLVLVMLAPVFGMFAAQAAESRSFTLEEIITISEKSYPVDITVNYTADTVADTSLEVAGDTGEDKKVNRPVADFNGVAIADSTVSSVTYEVRSGIDGFEVGSSGDAALNGCNWSVDNLSLKHGDNTVTFTATLDNGETQTYTQDIYYDAGEIYQRTKDEEAEENGTKYVKEIINIYFEIDTTDERIDEILAEIGGERVGEVNDIAMVQARVDAENLDALNKKCEEIEKYEEVVGAGIEQILPLEINVASTNDPWSTVTSHKETINEDIPGGYNWHAEAIQAYSTWEYDKFFSTAKVGIIDGPIMTDHEDLQGKISFNGSYSSHNTFASTAKDKAKQFHGTHVASTIGAIPNNGIGLSGILWDVDIYAANFQSSAASSDTLGYVASAISSHVTNGAKAVNLSLGLNDPSGSNPYLNPYSTADLDSTAKQCALGMNTLLKSGKEFVVVQSAGNGVTDTRLGVNVKRSVDATKNGLYCSIRTNGSYGSLTTAQVKEVYNRVIVVGAASNQSNNSNGLLFEMAPFSNAGSRVDIYAPGYSIFGAVTPQANSSGTYNIIYGITSGTSQAAPQVAAVAALCFAINPNFTGAQVRDLIRAEENTRCVVYDYSNMQKGSDGVYYDVHPLTGNGRMLSMKLVAEAAMRTVVGKANYTQLNRIVAIAQSLNPADFTNYEIVQSVIDSIDYNLYAYQQSEVDAKYIELLDAMDKLIERTPADYSAVEAAKAQAAALNPDDYVDFSGVASAVSAVVYGKYSDEQAAVDRMAQAILDAIAALETKVSIETLDSSVVADNSKKLIVFTTENLEYYFDTLEATGGYTVTQQANSRGTYSTGSTVTLSKSGSDAVVYTVAVLGDIDGNGKSDANDAFLTRMYAIGLLKTAQNAYTVAADADCDGTVTESDSMLVQESAIYNNAIFNDYTAGE